MNPQDRPAVGAARWARVAELFERLVDTTADERERILRDCCEDDPEMRREVESLLAGDRLAAAQDFESLGARAAATWADATNAGGESLVGRTLGRYRIDALLGAGGMGTVYRAWDPTLRRDVALKVLGSALATSAALRQRLQEEACAASSLNHPNIVTIYEVGCDAGIDFIAAELVAGETIRTRLGAGPLALRDVVDIGAQIAAALSAAHAAGLVHRDIKPENVVVRPDGVVKVLDFGLAMIELPVSADRPVGGGTASYMSPEQALGERVDHRSDLFSLGVVIYEMVTARQPFSGTTDAALADAIVNAPPLPPSHVRPGTAPAVDVLIARALEKEPDLRYQTASDLAADLKRLRRVSSAPVERPLGDRPLTTFPAEAVRRQDAPAPRTMRRRVFALAIGAAAVAALAAGGALWTPWGAPAAPTLPSRLMTATSFPGNEGEPSFSPDGNQIAFIWTGEKDAQPDVYVKLLDVGNPLQLTNDPHIERWPVWSPDGRFIAFTREAAVGQDVILMPALGGSERNLGAVEAGLDWSPDGRTLAVVDARAIALLSVESGERRRLTNPPATILTDALPAFSPDGQKLAFVRSDGGVENIFVVRIPDRQERQVTFETSRIQGLRWTADGRHLMYASNRAGAYHLWTIAESGGNPAQVVSAGHDISDIAISPDGSRLAFSRTFADTNIWRLELNAPFTQPANDSPPQWSPFIASTRADDSPQYSPDGQRIAFASQRTGSDEIWVSARDGSNALQLTSMGGATTGSPHWSPDGEWLAFDSRASGQADIFVISSRGGQPQRLTDDPSLDVVPRWSRDGRWIYFSSMRSGSRQIWKVPAGGGEAVQVTQHGGFDSFESVDGQWLYYTKQRETAGVFRMALGGGAEVALPELIDVKLHRAWTVTADGLLFVSAPATGPSILRFYRFATGRVSDISTLPGRPVYGPPGLAVSPDGRTILFVERDSAGSDIMLIENFHHVK